MRVCFMLLMVVESIPKATGNPRLAIVSTLGLLSIPQIAWESHRDLSHTVAATFTSSLLFYAVISLCRQSDRARILRWYVLIGFSSESGACSSATS